MQIQAWLVTDPSLKPQQTHPERVVRRWNMNYDNLTSYGTPEMAAFNGPNDPFGMEKDPNTPNDDQAKGVYLYWSLPPGLRHGYQDKPESLVQFPLVPNRWLIVRYYGPPSQRQVAAWVVESDYLDPQAVHSPSFPAPQQVGGTRIGRVISLNNWQESKGTDPLFLTAVTSGDITFSSFQPYCENVFSFHDAILLDSPTPISQQDTLSYFVAGWYSNSNQDILGTWVDTTDFTSLLQRLGWTLSSSSHVPEIRQVICHGSVCSIQWDQSVLPPSSQDKFTLENIRLAIGHNAAEALAALIADQNPYLIPSDLLKAFQSGLLAKLDTLDGASEVEQATHQSWFGVEPGGTIWRVVNPATADSSNPEAESVDLTSEELALLNNLNKQQVLLEEKQRVLQALQWNLYALWWKRGAAIALGTMPYGCTEKDFNEQLDPTSTASTSLLNQVNQQIQAVSLQMQQVTDAQLQLEDALKNDTSLIRSRILKALARDRFWHPADPVILISGIQSPWTEPVPDNLPCRYAEDLVTGLQYQDAQQTVWITTMQITHCMPTLNTSNLPVDVTALLAEQFLLDPINSACIASTLNLSADVLSTILTASTAPSVQGILPYYGLKAWTQPWFPLFLEWEVKWYPISFDGWQFDGEEYSLSKNPQQSNPQPQTLSGRILLMPQANFCFKGQLQQLISQDPSILSLLGENLAAFNQSIDQWDVLSQRLSGFFNQLILRNTQMNRTPRQFIGSTDIPAKKIDNLNGSSIIKCDINDSTKNNNRRTNSSTRADGFLQDGSKDDQIEQAVYNAEQQIEGLTQSLLHQAPIPGAPQPPPFESPMSFFQPVGQGQFYFSRVSVIDRFGQTVNVIQSDSAENYCPVISQSLQPSSGWTVDAEDPLRFIQLAPRVIQAVRLDFDWVSPTDDTQRLLFDASINPICGWLLPNYLDQGLVVYDATGQYLGEMSSISDNNNSTLVWDSSKMSFDTVVTSYPHLGPLLKNLQNAGTPAFQALFEIFDNAFSTVVPPSSRSNVYLTALIGRPLAIARSSWRLELAAPPYNDPTWFKTFESSLATDPFADFAFNVRVGDPTLSKDGVIGYFAGTDYNQFYSVYDYDTGSITTSYIQPIKGNYFSLQPEFPTQGQFTHQVWTTLLLEPHATLHAYTDILPVMIATLPDLYRDQIFATMQVTFRTGPLLLSRQLVPSIDPNQPAQSVIVAPKPSKGGNWSWLESPTSGNWQTLAIQNADATARVANDPAELVDGFLCLQQPAILAKSSTQITTTSNKPITLPSTQQSYRDSKRYPRFWSEVSKSQSIQKLSQPQSTTFLTLQHVVPKGKLKTEESTTQDQQELTHTPSKKLVGAKGMFASKEGRSNAALISHNSDEKASISNPLETEETSREAVKQETLKGYPVQKSSMKRNVASSIELGVKPQEEKSGKAPEKNPINQNKPSFTQSETRRKDEYFSSDEQQSSVHKLRHGTLG